MKYNQVRLHGSIANLPPMIFWEQWELGNIKMIAHPKNLQIKSPFDDL
jgi:hypothetical protein